MSLQTLINEKLRQEDEKRKDKLPSNKFIPSLLGRCFRIQILKRANIPPSNPPDERTLRIFKSSSLFHDFVQQFLPPFQVEVSCETDDFKGRADVVTEDSVYDIKSVHSGSFWYSKKEGYDIKKEKYHNWLQLAFYGWVLKKEKLVLIQISKDDLCIDEYADFTSHWLESLHEEIDILQFLWKEYEEQKSIPKAEPRFNNECKYCNYLDYCKKEEADGNREHPCDSPKLNSKKSRGNGKDTA